MIDKIKENWEKILLILKEEHEVSDVSYRTWLQPLTPYSFKGNTVTIIVPEQTFLAYVKKKYGLLLKVTISEFLDQDCDVDFKVKDQIEEEKQAQAPSLIQKNKAVVSPDVIQSANLNPKYTFDTFVVGSNNNLAHAAALAVAESPGEIYNPLFIYGGSGLGKTHLIQAIGNFYLTNNPGKRVLYTTSEKFTYELVNAIREKTNQDFRNKHRTVDLLLMDDVQFLATKELAQEEFFHTFNALYEAGKQIVLTSDRLPSETPHLADRLKTRFQMGLLADIQPPDYETRLAILKSKIEDEYFTFDEEIVEYVANNITSNVRDLEGALKRILAYAGIERTNTISMELAQKALKEILSTLPQRNITISVIIDEVEKYYRLPKGSLITKKRSNDIAYPRHIAMYISRVILDESYASIGDAFKRDHSTVMNAVKKIKKMVTEDTELQEIINELVTNIKKD